MRVIVIAVCMLIVAACPLPAESVYHRSTYCTTCERDSHTKIKRSSSARRAFLKSKGLTHTPKGCQVDHIKPLAKGGKDEPDNMQLLCGDALKQKEATELK
jgi:5-methylcytosine-specific restriction endonuclease McrA